MHEIIRPSKPAVNSVLVRIEKRYRWNFGPNPHVEQIIARPRNGEGAIAAESWMTAAFRQKNGHLREPGAFAGFADEIRVRLTTTVLILFDFVECSDIDETR
jgi:hypothetical protein